MGLGQVLSTSALGNIHKALLVIHKLDASEVDSSKVSASTEAALLGAASGLSATSAALGGSAGKVSVMQVQYNPSSLNIQANAEAIPFTYLQKNADSNVPSQNSRPPMVVLSVELVFDAMNQKDAFMAEKFSLSTGGAVSSAAGIAEAAEGGYTVQPQTDGLIAALMRSQTRVVTFRWADMAFTGQIIEAQAQYSMFSVSGRPVRSIVRLNIAQQVESDADVQYWDKALNKSIESGQLERGKDVGQELGNLLNLGAF